MGGDVRLARLERMVRRAQADHRVPALQAALTRADRPLWTLSVGTSGTERPLDDDTRFRIGSITKTFTAVLVMQCRDDGLLDLDDPIDAHLEVAAHGELTIRRLLSHTAGLQREPHGDVWDTLTAPDLNRLLADLAGAEQVLPPGRRFHYSNLAFALLGHAVAAVRGGTWAEVVADKILTPLGLTGTGAQPGPTAAQGYLVDAYSDHARPEPGTDFGAVAPAAQLWGTAADMATWGAFLADPARVDPDAAVLRPGTLDEMRWPVTTRDEVVWVGGVGLGLLLSPQPDRVTHVGHDGAMPGFLATAYGRRGGKDNPGALGCALLLSSGTAAAVPALVHDMLAAAVEDDPADIAAWVPGRPAPAEYASVLGRWWGEGFEYVFSWRDGALNCRGAGDAADAPPTVFEPLPGETDRLRGVAGREVGELLRLTRDADGTVIRLHWATYRFTRTQETFGPA